MASSFDKGCYVGQELTARMKHRGTASKRILTVKADSALPAAGTRDRAAATEIGEIAFGLRLSRLCLGAAGPPG